MALTHGFRALSDPVVEQAARLLALAEGTAFAAIARCRFERARRVGMYEPETTPHDFASYRERRPIAAGAFRVYADASLSQTAPPRPGKRA